MRTSRDTPDGAFVREARVPVRTPYRLDLTAVVLRRLSTNVVDTFDGQTYGRALGDPARPTVLRARQSAPDALTVTLRGPDAARFDPAALAERMLGTQRELGAFERGAKRFAWLGRIARAARGVKPPRYPGLWETVCNAVVYQQVSIHAAGAILRRVIERYAPAVDADGHALRVFPPPEVLVEADPAELRALGLSVQKVTALRQVGRALLDGALAEHALAPFPTPQLLAALVEHRGIGPWTAAVIALRGFGRLDLFPMRDSGAEAALRALSGDAACDVGRILDALAPQQGMLYYHLLLGRLVARGEITL